MRNVNGSLGPVGDDVLAAVTSRVTIAELEARHAKHNDEHARITIRLEQAGDVAAESKYSTMDPTRQSNRIGKAWLAAGWCMQRQETNGEQLVRRLGMTWDYWHWTCSNYAARLQGTPENVYVASNHLVVTFGNKDTLRVYFDHHSTEDYSMWGGIYSLRVYLQINSGERFRVGTFWTGQSDQEICDHIYDCVHAYARHIVKTVNTPCLEAGPIVAKVAGGQDVNGTAPIVATIEQQDAPKA